MQINMPDPVHITNCRVLYGDTDAGGVVYYANYLRYFEAGRTEFMRQMVCSYRDLEDRGLVLPAVESYLRYKAPAAYDDELLIETSLVELKNVSCRFNYRILKKMNNAAPKLLVKGFTVHASVDKSGKLIRMPEDVLATLKEKIKRL